MAKSPVAPKITTVSLLEDVSFIEAGLDLISGRKPPDAVETESQLPARARGEVVSSMDRDFDGRVAGLRCCDVLLLSVFSAKAAILSGRGHGGLVATQLLPIERLWHRFVQLLRPTQGVQLSRSANTTQHLPREVIRRTYGELPRSSLCGMVLLVWYMVWAIRGRGVRDDAVASRRSTVTNTREVKFKFIQYRITYL